jgi:DNA polymerase-4
VVLAASYQVRPFGVRSAMPMARAVRLCPQAIVVPPRFGAYSEASRQVHAILEEVTPLIEPLSLDEAFLDVTGSTALFGPPSAIALRLRKRIADELGLPASAGIAASKFVAKIASDSAKPDGQVEVTAEETVAFLAPLPLSRLWGVGPKTEALLRKLGLSTIGDLRARGEPWLSARLGDQGKAFHALSLGQDQRPVVADRQAKSIGAEETFGEDTRDPGRLRQALQEQAWRVARRARQSGLRGRVVEIKLKDEAFQVVHRRTTLPVPTDDGQIIFRAALELLDRARPPRPLRLTGVSLSDFSEPVQAGLFSAPIERRGALNRTLDRISERFGEGSVRPAELSGHPERPRIPFTKEE